MSSWYVFCALGLYPFSPADDKYIITAPIFDEVKWKTSTGKILTIKKIGKGRKITGITVNKQAIKGYFVDHAVFKEGGLIEINVK
jgi:putative alpha-1,2-mannosidase